MRPASILLVLSTASLTLASFAPTARAGGPAVCNAKHKRPANLYGSVLSDGLKPALAASATTPSAPDTSEPAHPLTTGSSAGAVKPMRLSQAELQASFRPCGRGRA